MSQSRNQVFKTLGIIAGIILLMLLGGQIFGEMELIVMILKATGLLLLGITILVTIHELGHFLPAKWFGMRVEAFSIGFPPKLFGFKKGDTEYQVGATPLGGYVKITGIIDESLDTEHLNKEPEPYEFRAKPVWQRMIVMVGGVTMNVILGILIFSMIKFIYGDVKTPMASLDQGIYVPASPGVQGEQYLGAVLGFETGDKILSVNGKKYDYLEDYSNSQQEWLEDNAYFEVDRKGQMVRIEIPADIQRYFDKDSMVVVPLFAANHSAQVDVPVKTDNGQSRAYEAGLRSGDIILQIDTNQVARYREIPAVLANYPNQTIPVTFLRGQDTMKIDIALDSTTMGVVPRGLDTLDYGFFQSFGIGTKNAFGIVTANVAGFRNMAQGDADVSKSVKGPIQIAKYFLIAFERGGVKAFLNLTAVLSMVLAFVNILPIPALDGGHLLFLLIEGITRKEPSPKVRIIAQQIGMVFILGLMVLVLFNDVIQSIFN
ncbi:RIP metalloprotease RseP [Pontibacter sp. G13]|uniref:RIP metalloprotease RseP n=1 Tax=Pontibacter sp. G13 TaxID=3074898 RepID=UPI00288BFA11|nr:RIP metalloprotease RseP [Pontibacter sp. G13]WNJ19876.1 RIP metalloprotease RseP [Pontibacter sp. G13]